MAATSALARRAFADARTRTISFALLFAFAAVAQPIGYRHSYPTLEDRLAFAQSFGANKAIRLFYGTPHDLLSVGGYSAWRVGGSIAIFAALWGLLAAIRGLRAEEESGRLELVLGGPVSRHTALVATLLAIGGGALVLWAALWLGLVAGGLAAGGSAYLALAALSPLPVFVGVGAVCSQLAPTRRLALELASVTLVALLALRIVADTSTQLGWLRWTTPLGWAEELRPFADPQPAVLLAPLAGGAVLIAAAAMLAARRDIGTGLLPAGDTAPPRLRLLGSTTAHALRDERASLAGWFAGVAFYAVIVGLLSHSFTSENIPADLQRQIEKFGGASITNPAGALSFYFLFFVLVISLFSCSQIAAIRREEADQRLETLFALPVGRRAWMAGRLALATAAAALLALTAGAVAWAGSAVQGGGPGFAEMLGAGANCLPAALLFLALGALAFATVPRATSGVAYGLVALTFVWELFGAVLGAPAWIQGLSPFHHIGLVPAQPFDAVGAVAMLGLAAAATAAAIGAFGRRDLQAI